VKVSDGSRPFHECRPHCTMNPSASESGDWSLPSTSSWRNSTNAVQAASTSLTWSGSWP
jgi:hypothetical protein